MKYPEEVPGIRMRSLALAALIGLGFTACSGGGSDVAPVAGQAPSPLPAPSPGAGSGGVPDAFDVGATYTRELYVAINGNDSSGDGSAARPYASLRRAAMAATPGTRVRVQPGTYGAVGTISNLQGSAPAPIALVADGAVIFDAAGGGGVMQFSDPRYVVIEGFTLQNATGNGINVDDGGSYVTPAEYLMLRRLRVRNIGTGGNSDCIKLSGVDRFHVLDSEMSACNAGNTIDMVGCHDGVIAGNHFHDSPGGGVQAKGGSADILIHGNRFIDMPGRSVNAGGSTGLQFFRPIDATYEGARIRMIANLFVRAGANSGAPVALVGCDACVFAHNTIIEPRTWVARILQESTDARFVPSRNGHFINNIIVFNNADLRAYVNVGAGTAPDTFSFGSNLWYSLDNAGFSGPSYAGTGIPPESGSIIQRDPLFTNSAGADYHLTAGSPAIGQGRSVPGNAPSDYDRRAYASPPALGAFAAP